MEPNLERYQAIIFDMDGTLIDTMPAHVIAWRQTAERFAFDFEEEWLNSLGGMPSPKIVLEINRRFNLSIDPKEASTFKSSCFSAIKDKGELIDITHRILLNNMQQKKVAIGTGSQRVGAIALLESKGVIDYFDAIVTATEVENHKPFPDTFLLAAQQMNVAAESCVVFEDTLLGLQAAHAAGMDCYLVTEKGLEFNPAV